MIEDEHDATEESMQTKIDRYIQNEDNLYAAAIEHLYIAHSLLLKDLELKGSKELIIEYWAIEKLLNIYTLKQ